MTVILNETVNDLSLFMSLQLIGNEPRSLEASVGYIVYFPAAKVTNEGKFVLTKSIYFNISCA